VTVVGKNINSSFVSIKTPFFFSLLSFILDLFQAAKYEVDLLSTFVHMIHWLGWVTMVHRVA
jgi:hypothetical protein